MALSIIVAASQNGVIGKGNRLPWKLPADLKRFKSLTMNHPVIMGRKTFESIGRALPGRKNIVITRRTDYRAQGCLVAHSLEEALTLCNPNEEVFVIGGASIYEQALPLAQKIYLTLIHHDFVGDTRLFTFDKKIWKEASRQNFPADEENLYPYSFLLFERKSNA